MRDRSYTRWRREVAVAKARGRAARLGIVADGWIDAAAVEAWVVRSATTPHPCSRSCCGNPRAFGQGPSVADRRRLHVDRDGD